MPNTYTNLLFHIVFSTKHRKPLIKAHWQDDLYAYMGGIIRDEKGSLLIARGMPDHVLCWAATADDRRLGYVTADQDEFVKMGGRAHRRVLLPVAGRLRGVFGKRVPGRSRPQLRPMSNGASSNEVI